MIWKIFQEMKEIRDNGGIRLTLDFVTGKTHDVVVIPVIQFIKELYVLRKAVNTYAKLTTNNK